MAVADLADPLEVPRRRRKQGRLKFWTGSTKTAARCPSPSRMMPVSISSAAQTPKASTSSPCSGARRSGVGTLMVPGRAAQHLLQLRDASATGHPFGACTM